MSSLAAPSRSELRGVLRGVLFSPRFTPAQKRAVGQVLADRDAFEDLYYELRESAGRYAGPVLDWTKYFVEHIEEVMAAVLKIAETLVKVIDLFSGPAAAAEATT